jgi:hypothetical protein
MKGNLGTVDRVIRGLVGLSMIAAGVLLVKGALGVLLGLVGAILIFSGTVGFCHVYKVLGIRTCRRG